MRNEIIISEAGPRGNLAENLAGVIDKDGDHVVFDDGRRLVATVLNRSVVDWTAMEEDGSEVATVVFRHPGQTSPEAALDDAPAANRRARWAIVCACYEFGDRCWWEPY
jgi:hypothetical protein